MKVLTTKLSLLALVVLAVSSCKPKIDADFVNSLMNSQTKINESVQAIKSSTASMTSFKDVMMKQAAEMKDTESAGGANELVSMVTSLFPIFLPILRMGRNPDVYKTRFLLHPKKLG
ncbi:MAG TPA: hypothetical protein ENK85_09905 [Saprospiraceae bacterium]|nr:hypothetical protein [Saprospiraceae bacterium]